MIDYSGLYQYYHPLIPTARSQCTLDYDLGNSLRISTNTASELFELHYKKYKSILYEKDYLSSFIKAFEVKAEEYDNYIIGNQKSTGGVYKFLYAVQCPAFIYTWIECYKTYMDQQTLRNLQKIIATKYHSNRTVDAYIRRDSLKTELLNFSTDAFMKFYDYCRLQYLLQNITQFNYIPKFYDPSNGILYFTTKNKTKWEHIFDRVGSNKTLVVTFNPTTINTNYGMVSTSKNLKNGKWHQMVNIDSSIPNFVRFALEFILLKNRNIESLDQAKLYSYKQCIMLEDFCKKSYDGYTMDLPTKNSWQKLGGIELRKLSHNEMNLNTVYDSYDSSLLNPVLQGCWA